MPYDNFISATDAAALIPESTSKEIIQNVVNANPLFNLASRLPNFPRAVHTMPVLSGLATASFVSGTMGDGDLKPTSDFSWDHVTITAEELAVIIPIQEAVLEDAEYDIWSQIKPKLVDAFNKAIVEAVLFGTNIPASWSTALAGGINAGAIAASHAIKVGDYADVFEALLGEDDTDPDAIAAGLWGLIEADGYDVTGAIGHVSMKSKLRNVRDTQGNLIFMRSPQERAQYELNGVPVYFPNDGSIAAATALLFAGDWSKLVYAFRQEMTYKVLTEAVIQDNTGAITMNLAQQDMVALRAKMRLGFALPTPVSYMSASPYPFAVLQPGSTGG